MVSNCGSVGRGRAFVRDAGTSLNVAVASGRVRKADGSGRVGTRASRSRQRLRLTPLLAGPIKTHP